jgi:hypothetical protein
MLYSVVIIFDLHIPDLFPPGERNFLVCHSVQLFIFGHIKQSIAA